MEKEEESYYRALVYQASALSGCARSSSYSYFLYARQFWRHFDKPPLQINDSDIAGYFYWLLRVKNVSSSTLIVARTGVYYLYKGLGADRPCLKTIKAPKVSQHPELISQEEIKLLISKIESPIFKMFFSLLQGTGLRLSEGRNLQTDDIDGDRLILKIRRGKGNKDRIVPLPASLYADLRLYWSRCQPPSPWLFPNPQTEAPYTGRTLQRAFYQARKSCKLRDGITIHTLRHSYATKLLENGVHLKVLQKILGHSSLNSTMIYLHLSTRTFENAQKIINDIFKNEN